MRHSRSISDLRADVAENCRALLMLAEREGLSVLVTETVRDAAYQRMLAEKGYAAKGAVTPSFHAEHAGLAFDICKNEAGHEYDDPAFFIRVGEIGKMLGFSWGGDWGSFPDRPHFQWDAGATYTSAMIRAKRYLPEKTGAADAGRLERGGARLGGEKRPDRGRRGGEQTVPQLFDARADGGADAAL